MYTNHCALVSLETICNPMQAVARGVQIIFEPFSIKYILPSVDDG